MAKATVNVDVKIRNRVKRHILKTKQTVGGFYDLAAKEKLERDLIKNGMPDLNQTIK